MRLVLIVAIFSTLVACRAIPNAVCPALIEYDPAFNQHLTAEIEYLPADSAVLRVVRDYVALRDQVRACRMSD